MTRRKPQRQQVAVDRIACSGHGVCAQVAPGLFELDEFGYPIVTHEHLGRQKSNAARAIRLCPARALYLKEVNPAVGNPETPGSPLSPGSPELVDCDDLGPVEEET